mmetsp:Transcript_41023/g.98909  ORF Transcript_41023/g.98909 Transcript_41023/m.98909 type:complete len:190 (+) Transcript_41023:682-1251(+)
MLDSALLIACEGADSHVLQDDDHVSVLAFNDGASSRLANGAQPNFVQMLRSNNCYSTFEMSTQQSNPMYFEGEHIRDASTISGFGMHIPREEEEPRVYQGPVASIEKMVAKLDRSMMRSDKSREMLCKTVFAELPLRKRQIEASSPKTKGSVNKARRLSYKRHTYTGATKVVSRQHNNLISFLRASKKW